MAVVGLGIALIPAGSASAAGAVGYVRLAHLSPDTPDVDVYLSAVGGGKPQKFAGVGYGVFSTYLSLPVGTYAVSMRNAGAPGTTDALLTTNVTVAQGKAYTVAGVGHRAELGLKVIQDDLAPPPAGKAKIRIIQASVRAPVMDVGILHGAGIADSIPFATTTQYYTAPPGRWTLHCVGTNSGPQTTLGVRLKDGAIYTLLVLDDKKTGGITSQLRLDAGSRGAMPAGGVQTGAGGMAARPASPLLIGVGVLFALLAGGLLLGLRHRRTTAA